MPPRHAQTLLLATAAAALFYSLWHLAPHAALIAAKQSDQRATWRSNATLARLRARKQLQVGHSPHLLFTASELLMLHHHDDAAGRRQPTAANGTRKVWSRQREFDRVMVPGWLRRLRLWLMVD